MFNDSYPKSSSFAAWALKRAPEKMDVCEFEGKYYFELSKLFTCNIGKKIGSIRSEIGCERIYLNNTELHQIWIEQVGHYVSDYGRVRVGEVRFEVAACCRCKGALVEREYALLGACEDCIDDAARDPEGLLEEFSNGVWD